MIYFKCFYIYFLKIPQVPFSCKILRLCSPHYLEKISPADPDQLKKASSHQSTERKTAYKATLKTLFPPCFSASLTFFPNFLSSSSHENFPELWFTSRQNRYFSIFQLFQLIFQLFFQSLDASDTSTSLTPDKYRGYTDHTNWRSIAVSNLDSLETRVKTPLLSTRVSHYKQAQKSAEECLRSNVPFYKDRFLDSNNLSALPFTRMEKKNPVVKKIKA